MSLPRNRTCSQWIFRPVVHKTLSEFQWNVVAYYIYYFLAESCRSVTKFLINPPSTKYVSLSAVAPILISNISLSKLFIYPTVVADSHT